MDIIRGDGGLSDQKILKNAGLKLKQQPVQQQIEREQFLNLALKIVKLAKMSDDLKGLIYLRLQGWTLDEIAMQWSVRVETVESLEKEALFYIAEHLKRNSLESLISKFNSEPAQERSLKDKLANPQRPPDTEQTNLGNEPSTEGAKDG